MKKNTKRLLALLGIVAILVTSVVSVNAEDIDAIISSLTHERILNIATDNNYLGNHCHSIQSMAVGRSHDSLFVAKIPENDLDCILYYYPDFNDSNVTISNKKALISIVNSGHVNGMAIDDSNIYLTGPKSTTSKAQKTDYIIKIPRSLIASLANQLWNGVITEAVINEKTATQNGYTKLIPKVSNTDPSTSQTTPYVDYNRIISNITCIDINGVKVNGNFIINYHLPGTSYKNNSLNRTAFTRAKVMQYNGQEFLYIYESTNKVFFVKNTLSGTNLMNADICYSSACGFFVPKFYDEEVVPNSNRRTKNVILWADIDGTATETVTFGGHTYPCFVPDKINLNPKNHHETLNNVTKPLYKTFEIEGMDFDQNNDLYFSANVEYVGEGNNADTSVERFDIVDSDDNPYGRTVSAIGHDGVFKLVRTDGDYGWTLVDKPT